MLGMHDTVFSFISPILSSVFNPLPVMNATTVSSFLILPFLTNSFKLEITTPPAVSVNIPSVSAKSLIESMMLFSEAISALPCVWFNTSTEYGPDAGFPIANDFAIVDGLTGLI